MIKLSISSMWDALCHSTERFATLKKIEVGSNSDILWADDYSVVFIVKVDGKERLIKIFNNENGERAQKILSTFRVLQHPNFAFVEKGEYYPEELTILFPDNGSQTSVGVMLLDIPSPDIFNFISICDNGAHNILSGFIHTVSVILRYGALFDLLNVNDFRCSDEGDVTLSPVSNYMLSNNSLGNNIESQAFINFIVGATLRVAIECFEADSGEVKIEYSKVGDKFDVRLPERYINDNYVAWLNEMADIAENECERDCSELRKVIGSTDVLQVISALQHFCDVQIPYKEPRLFKYLEIIGTYSENRVSVRDNRTGLFGYVDFNMKKVIDCIFNEVTDFVEEVAVCAKGDDYGAINRNGEIIIPFEYSSLEWDVKEGRFICVKDGNEFYINRYE